MAGYIEMLLIVSTFDLVHMYHYNAVMNPKLSAFRVVHRGVNTFGHIVGKCYVIESACL